MQRSRVRYTALPDFLSSSGSETGSTQPREVNWGATGIKSSGSGPENRLTAVEIRCADHVTSLYPQKMALTSPTGGGRSVGIVRSRTKATEFTLVFSSSICNTPDSYWVNVVCTCRSQDRWNWTLYLILVAVTEYDDFVIDVLMNWAQNKTHKKLRIVSSKALFNIRILLLKKWHLLTS